MLFVSKNSYSGLYLKLFSLCLLLIFFFNLEAVSFIKTVPNTHSFRLRRPASGSHVNRGDSKRPAVRRCAREPGSHRRMRLAQRGKREQFR